MCVHKINLLEGSTFHAITDLFLISPSNKTVTELDRTAFVCVPANPMFQANWLSNFSFFTIGPSNYYLLVEDVERTLPVSCSINGIIASSMLSVQGEVLKLYKMICVFLCNKYNFNANGHLNM